MLRKLCFAALVAGLALVGCGPKRSVPIYQPAKFYKSIVSLSPSTSEITYLQLGADKLKGRTSSCNWPLGIERVPLVMTGTKPDLEAIAKIAPDMIIYDPLTLSESDVAKLKDLKIELYPVKAGNVKEFKASLSELGGKLHVETSVWEYIDKIDAAISNAQSSATGTKAKIAVLMPGEGTEHYIAGLKSLQADYVRCSGGDPVGPDETKFVPLNAESLISMNPDVIFVAGKVDSILADPRLKSIKAIQSKKVIGVKQDLILRAGSRVDTLIENLAKKVAK